MTVCATCGHTEGNHWQEPSHISEPGTVGACELCPCEDWSQLLDSSDEIVMVGVARGDLEAVLLDMKQTFSAMPRNITFSRSRLGRAIQVVEGWLA